MWVFGKSAHNVFKYQVNNMGCTVAFYKETVAYKVTFWAWSLEWDLLPHCKTRTKVDGFSWTFILLVLQALPLDLNKQGNRQVAQLYIVESLALGMSPYNLCLVEVCFMVSVTVCDNIAMSAFNMCVVKLESLYYIYLTIWWLLTGNS